MRDYQANEPIDLIVSELLGSFGDNELCPECLDGVICWLATDGVLIPSGYSLFLAPLTSHKICSKVIEMGKFETPYVVMIHSGQIISSNNASKLTGATSMKSAMINEQVSYGSGRVQELIGGDDINPEDYDSVERAWSRYIESYSDMSIERTIGLDGIKVKEPFLKRYSTIFY
ncbi:PRMT5 arginine-N-methyltransferase-domain-containing protein [Phakopsora pachyrhizi]|uniref:PRMT5 arginine-N-methyltransferase-domain-containing protein n=1 Tax=Phakopsora pachyrhizi TaxID=170000 RepID=A0AAV0BSB4_PHAPC|nr:PRMT5 arginine-N-methyltransferase-domain-containing protein [Phakopsora pachyrhizi]